MNERNEPAVEAQPTSRLREVVSHASIVLFSSIFVQGATFCVQSIAGLALPVQEFAHLSLIIASTMVAVAFFDLGLGLTATKKYCESLDVRYLRTSFYAWAMLIPLGATLSAVVWLVFGADDIALGIALGAVLNLWNGVRSIDQARQDYKSFLRSSLSFSIVRLGAGLISLYVWKSPVVIAVCVYALPLLVLPFSASSFRFAVEAFSSPRKPLGDLSGYALPVYLNAVSYGALPYVPQFFVGARLTSVEVSTYGLILTYTAPAALIIGTLYNVLLPKFLDAQSNLEDRLWSLEGGLLLGGGLLCILFAGLFGGYVISIIYESRFPVIGREFSVYFIGYATSVTIGIYTLTVHTQGVPQLAMLVHTVKLIMTVALLYIFGSSLETIVLWTVAMMILGQAVVICYLLASREKGRRAVRSATKPD